MRILYAFLFALLFLISANLQAQTPELDNLLEEGIRLHDAGDFNGAIAKYDEMLEAEPENFGAQAEKSMSQFMARDYEKCIDLCEHIIKIHKEEESLYLVYTTLGNALDNAGKPQEAIDAYERGIEKFPDHYMLHFNLGVTYLREGETEKGIKSLVDDLRTNPHHPGGNYALGVALASQNKRSLALMALCRFMMLEVGTNRNALAFGLITEILGGNAEKTGRKSQTITLSMPPEEGEADDLSAVDLMIDILSLAEDDKKLKKLNKKLDPAERMSNSIGSLFGVAGELYGKGDVEGPISDLYIPFFIALDEKEFTLPLCYVIHSYEGDKNVEKWLEENIETVEEMIRWSFEEGEND